jgi:hypothetical protein
MKIKIKINIYIKKENTHSIGRQSMCTGTNVYCTKNPPANQGGGSFG